MNALRSLPASLSCPPAEVDELRRAVLEFEESWRRGDEPSLEEHWSRLGPGASITILAALVKSDLGHRFDRGERPAVADYLGRFPALAGERDRMVSLIYEEFCLREEQGERPDPDGFCARYAEWRDSIRSQLRYHSLLSQVVSPSSPPRFPEEGERFGGFRLNKVLGQGGAARVFKAQEEELGGRDVVLKVSPNRGNEPSLQAKLNHVNIIKVYGVVNPPETDLRGLSMPYLPGTPLDRVIERLDPSARTRRARAIWDALSETAPPPDERRASPDSRGWQGFPIGGSYADGVAWVVAALARALEHAHSQGILHRDVKPANVLLTIPEGPQLFDFNLAHAEHGAEGASAAIRGGTLPYMAPEQLEAFLDPARWEGVGPSADLYALGLVLDEMLTGERPEPPDPTLSTPRAIAEMLDRRALPTPPARSRNPRVPHALDAILARCLAHRPEDRYPSAGALAEDLERYLRREPLRFATNPSRREVAANWARRNRAAIAAAAALLAAWPALSAAGWVADRLDPNAPAKYVKVGGDHADARRFGRARDAYEHALSLDPGLFSAYWGLALVDRNERRYERSRANLDKALEIALAPAAQLPPWKISDILTDRARLSIEWGLAIRSGPRSGGQANIEAGPYYARALEDLDRARGLWGGDVDRRYLVEFLTAKARIGLGDAASARDAYESSVASYSAAVRDLEAALRLKPGMDEARALLKEAEARRDVDARNLEPGRRSVVASRPGGHAGSGGD